MRKPTRPVPLALALAVHVVVTSITWHDLNRRTSAEVRGPTWLWRIASGANTMGSVAYWLLGRRPVEHTAPA